MGAGRGGAIIAAGGKCIVCKVGTPDKESLYDPNTELAIANPLTRWVTRRRTARLFDLMAGFVHSQVLLSCVRLGLFARLKEVGAVRPYEAGHLLTRLFARASTKTTWPLTASRRCWCAAVRQGPWRSTGRWRTPPR